MSDYQQTPVVTRFHHVSRYGHTSSLASLASPEESIRKEYVDGIAAVSITILAISLVWLLVLLVLKMCGSRRVGCAANGKAINISQLRKENVSRKVRKRRIKRAWNTQFVFMISCFALTTFTFLFMNRGLNPFVDSLGDIVDINENLSGNVTEAKNIAASMVSARNRLFLLVDSMKLDKLCPYHFQSDAINETGLLKINRTIWTGMEKLDSFVENYVQDVAPALAKAEGSAIFVESSVDAIESYSRLIRGFLIAINTLNIILFSGAFVARLGRNDRYFQGFLAYLVVPSFGLLMIASVIMTCTFAATSLLNADFCSGGEAPGSPRGTVEDILAQQGSGKGNLTFDSLQYYSSNCTGENPFSFVDDYYNNVEYHKQGALDIANTIRLFGIDRISDECGVDMSPLNETLFQVVDRLQFFAKDLNSTKDLTSCSNLQPLVTDLLNGPPCTDSIKAMSWLLGGMMAMTLLGLIMLSTRAALYNTIIEARRIKRREREFQEYKEYMAQYYDTSDWKMDPPSKKDNDDIVRQAPTFETDDSSAGSERSPSISSEGSPSFDSEGSHISRSPLSSNYHVSFDDSMGAHCIVEDITTPTKVLKAEEAPTPASRISRISAVAHAAVSVANALELFKNTDPEIEYYSSDSEDDDDSVSARSHISEFFNRFTGHTEQQAGEFRSAEEFHRAVPELHENGRRSIRWGLTPQKRQQPGPATYFSKYITGYPQRFSSPASSHPDDETDDNDEEYGPKPVRSEMKPLTPSPMRKGQRREKVENVKKHDAPIAPRKDRKALARTSGR